MNYAEIKKCDIANGPGVRVSLFVSGCTNHCNGCFNEALWDFNYGEEFTYDTLEYILSLLEPPWISGLSVLGGEPFEYQNTPIVSLIIKIVKTRFPEKTIWVYTGYVFENILMDDMIKMFDALDYIDAIVDGPYIESMKDISLRFRGSSNQRIIDVQKSMKKNQTELYDEAALD